LPQPQIADRVDTGGCQGKQQQHRFSSQKGVTGPDCFGHSTSKANASTTFFYGSSNFPVKPGLGGCTAEAPRTRSKELLVEKISDLCELRASVVNPFFTENPE
jgi:hypothetical protein